MASSISSPQLDVDFACAMYGSFELVLWFPTLREDVSVGQ